MEGWWSRAGLCCERRLDGCAEGLDVNRIYDQYFLDVLMVRYDVCCFVLEVLKMSWYMQELTHSSHKLMNIASMEITCAYLEALIV